MSNLTSVFSTILEFFKNVGQFLVEKLTTGTQPTDLLLWIVLGSFVIYIIATVLRTNHSYEARLFKAVDDLNLYFYRNPVINDENLVPFNNKMKQVPKAMRIQWQLFMLNRDKPVSEYLSLENCIERPLKSTSYKNSVKTISWIFNIFIGLLFVVSFAGIVFNSVSTDLGYALYYSIVMPFLVYALKTIFLIFIHIRYNSIVADLYNNFNVFQRGIDKATASLPDYIDYEVLFTRKEIKSSIPILQDYIERRERLEKEELEKARLSQVEHEKFDFSAAGFDGSLLLERALKECEIYINNKKRLLLKIAQKNDELTSYKNSYEALAKEQAKQQQASKENLERLRLSAETSTNRVDASRIKKQQQKEMERQEQLEKDAQIAYDKFVNEKGIIEEDVKKLEQELLDKKNYIEEVIVAEFKTYSDKMYVSLEEISKANVQQEIDELISDKDKLTGELQDRIKQLDDKDKELQTAYSEVEKKQEEIERKDAELLSKTEAIEKITDEITDKAKQLVETREAQVKEEPEEPEYDENGGYYDSEGYYRFRDGGYYDPEGRYFDADGNLVEVEETKIEETFEPVYDDHGGYFDQEGYYRYQDGSYYDPEGRYFDANGNLVAEETTVEDEQSAQVEAVVEEVSTTADESVIEEVLPVQEVEEAVQENEENLPVNEVVNEDSSEEVKVEDSVLESTEEVTAPSTAEIVEEVPQEAVEEVKSESVDEVLTEEDPKIEEVPVEEPKVDEAQEVASVEEIKEDTITEDNVAVEESAIEELQAVEVPKVEEEVEKVHDEEVQRVEDAELEAEGEEKPEKKNNDDDEDEGKKTSSKKSTGSTTKKSTTSAAKKPVATTKKTSASKSNVSKKEDNENSKKTTTKKSSSSKSDTAKKSTSGKSSTAKKSTTKKAKKDTTQLSDIVNEIEKVNKKLAESHEELKNHINNIGSNN